MNTHKLNEALAEMRHQRAVLDVAIKNIESVLATLSEPSSTPLATSDAPRRSAKEPSYIDLGVKVLADAGNPLHISEIAKRISESRGKEIPRASVESSFIRHIKAFGDSARIVKVRPAYFGLPAWKSLFSEQPQHHAA